jgi:hypothetical protein
MTNRSIYTESNYSVSTILHDASPASAIVLSSPLSLLITRQIFKKKKAVAVICIYRAQSELSDECRAE